MVMLKLIKQLLGAFNIWLNRIIQGTRAAFRSRGIKQRTQRDALTLMRQDLLDDMKSRDESKPDIQALMQSFLQTPEGQKMKAEATLQVANAYLQKILIMSQQPELDLKQKMLLNLALMEVLQQLEKNEKTINSIQLSNDNEIS